jgi:hypothetical protein
MEKILANYGILMGMTDREEKLLDLINQAESCLLGLTYSGQPLHSDVEKAVLQIQSTAQTLLDKKRPEKVRQDKSGFIMSNN